MIEKIIAEIDAELARLNQVKALLASSAMLARRGPRRPSQTAIPAAPKKAKRRTMSTEAREKIRQAQLKRWASQKKSAKSSAK